MDAPETTQESASEPAEQDVALDDEALAEASGAQSTNATEIVYASTFVPFDSSF